MTCRDFTAFIADFLDGELPAAERQQFERHLGRYVNCARYLGDAPVPPEVPDELVDAILRVRRSSSDD